MKTSVIAALLILVPVAVFGTPTMGLYFDYWPGQMHYYPSAIGEQLDAYVCGHHASCYVSAVEFMLELPPGVAMTTFTIPDGSMNMGDPVSGISITYWPPLNFYIQNYHMLCQVNLLFIEFCLRYGGTMADVPIRIVDHPTGGGIYGTCWPDNDMFDFIGLTSILCPGLIGVEDKSWGAIKSMYE